MFSHREILEAFSAGVVASALDEIALYANRAACELLELSADRCIGQPVPLLLGMTMPLADHLFGLGDECRLDVELPTGPAGVTVRRAPALGYVCAFRTKRDGRSADAQLSRYEREASLGVLVSSFAHEVRNPLATIQASIDMMRGELVGVDTAQHHLAIIERQLGRLADLSRSPMLAGQLSSAHRVLCHVHELAASAIAAVAVEARRRRVEIALAVPELLPRVLVDEHGMVDAIAELLENAIHASHEGTIVSLSARAVQVEIGDGRDRRRVAIEIEDRGYGMRRSEIAPALRVFSSTKAGASGLGLPIARHHVEQSGGRLAIESAPEVGTVVRVELLAEEPR
jgi:signal transduction histidine kinase